MKKTQLWFVALILLLTACGSAPPAEPVNIGVTLDNSRAVSQVIPITGGSLTATSADGTTYTLEIPGDALLNETEISMTPVESLSGMPFGSEPTLAVQLEPEGLALYNFAILTITPAQEIPVDQQIVFDYQADGQNLGLALPVVESLEIQIQLLHFSGYGVTKGFLADLELVRQRLGGSEERRMQSLVAEEIHRDRWDRERDSELYSELRQDIVQQYYDKVVKPRLGAAGESCANGRLATETYITYAKQVELMGASKNIVADMVVQIVNLAVKSMKICLQEEYELCRDEHIVHRILPAVTRIGRVFQVLRAADSTLSLSLAQEAVQLVEKCLRFELEFKSTAAGGILTDGSRLELRVSAVVPIRFDASTLEFSGEGPLVQEYVLIAAECSNPIFTSGAATFQVFNLVWPPVPPPEIKPGEVITEEQLGQIKDLVLDFDPEQTSESWGYSCPNLGYPVDSPHPYWHYFFTPAHLDELVGTGYVFKDWQILGDELFAKKEWQREAVDLIESGSFILYHRPE